MGKADINQNILGIYISPKEISIARTKCLSDGKIQVEHLVKIPTNFEIKEKNVRPLTLNNNFFDEKASWVGPFKQALKKIDWNAEKVVVTFSSQFSILRFFVMPYVDRRYWSKTVPLESKKYIPVSFEEITYDFMICPNEKEKKLNILFGITKKKSVEFLIKLLKTCDMELMSVEACACSAERLFAFLDTDGHDKNAYIHFSDTVNYMVFSHEGCPVLFREIDMASTSSMTERKQLDIKGAAQFVNRYLGQKVYSNIMISGDNLQVWESVAQAESPIKIAKWDIKRLVGNLKDNDLATLFSIGASLKNKSGDKIRIDFSGISNTALLEKNVQKYVKSIAIVLGAIILSLTLLNQFRLYIVTEKMRSIYAEMGDFGEVRNMSADMVRDNTEKLKENARMLQSLVSNKDVLAPKLQIIVDTIPKHLWNTSIHYINPVGSSSEGRAVNKEMRIVGATYLQGDLKLRFIQMFKHALKNAEEFKIYGSSLGSIDVNIDARQSSEEAEAARASGFTIICTSNKGGG